MQLLLIDHLDSFTHNLAQLFLEQGVNLRVVRPAQIPPSTLQAWGIQPSTNSPGFPQPRSAARDEVPASPSFQAAWPLPDWLCLSPGPGTPTDQPLSLELISRLAGRVPILGVCLGMQLINEAFGGQTVPAPLPRHGKRSSLHHTGLGPFAGLPSPLTVARYHSLQCRVQNPDLEPLAWAEDGVLMALRHRHFPMWGLQFHPESFMSQAGAELLRAFLRLHPGWPERPTRSSPHPSPSRLRLAPRCSSLLAPVPPAPHAPLFHRPPRSPLPLEANAFTPSRLKVLTSTPRIPFSDQSFVRLARGISQQAPSLALLSGSTLDCAAHSLLAWDPLLLFTARGRQLTLQRGTDRHTWEGDPLGTLDSLLDRLAPLEALTPPFSGGALGYLAYELKNQLETLPQTAQDDLDLPTVYLFFPRRLLVHHRFDQQAQIFTFDSDQAALERLLQSTLALVTEGQPPLEAESAAEQDPGHTPDSGVVAATDAADLQSCFSRDAYLEALHVLRRLIREGEVYQVNLSQRFRFPYEGHPFPLLEGLFARNPAPFYAFLQAGDHQILSTSMERFLLRQGSRVETRPIKGTRPRGTTPLEDQALQADLKQSPKDDAELSMIVDLLRNDLGRVCRPGSVRVTDHKRLEAWQNVSHLVSRVEGRLEAGVSAGALLQATFPGGSITGCPRIRAMEVIDQLEPVVRHVYTGSIGYIGFHENMDLSVAIRTAIFHRGTGYFSVGGGVVYDSKAADEYQETLDKGRAFFERLRGDAGQAEAQLAGTGKTGSSS